MKPINFITNNINNNNRIKTNKLNENNHGTKTLYNQKFLEKKFYTQKI